MPYTISKNDVPPHIRRPHVERYRKQLRAALLDPTMSESHKVAIRQRLANLSTDESKPIAPTVPESITLYPTTGDLLKLKKQEMVEVAAAEGVDISDVNNVTKQQIAGMVFANREAKGPELFNGTSAKPPEG